MNKHIIQKLYRCTICKWFGHKPMFVIEGRPRFRLKGKSIMNHTKYYKHVRGIYEVCEWCGKKLTNFERI